MTDKLTFDSVYLGLELPELVRTVDQETFNINAAASLDYNPVHVNPEWCRRSGVFGTGATVAHGMMTMSFMASMLSDWAYPSGGWIWDMDTKFVKPVTAGSRVTCSGVVTELHFHGEGENYVVVDMKAVNQDGDTLAVGKAKVALPDA
jgi:acyl dehydratase